MDISSLEHAVQQPMWRFFTPRTRTRKDYHEWVSTIHLMLARDNERNGDMKRAAWHRDREQNTWRPYLSYEASKTIDELLHGCRCRCH